MVEWQKAKEHALRFGRRGTLGGPREGTWEIDPLVIEQLDPENLIHFEKLIFLSLSARVYLNLLLGISYDISITLI